MIYSFLFKKFGFQASSTFFNLFPGISCDFWTQNDSSLRTHQDPPSLRLNFAWWISRTLRLNTAWFLITMLLLVSGGCALIHALRLSYVSKRSLITGMEEFDVHQVECLNESDRTSIHAAIVKWYGSLEAFSEYVRGPLRQDVLEPMKAPGSLPFGYMCILATPAVTTCFEGVLAFIKVNKSWEAILRYSLSYIFCFALCWLPAVLLLMIFLCESWATPRSSCASGFQTLGIVLLGCMLSMLGAAGALGAYFGGLAAILLWLGVSLLFAGIVWRYCGHRRA